MINIYIFHIYLPCTIVHSTENQKNCWKPLFIPIKIILWQKSIFLIYKKNQYVQNGAKCRMIDRIFGCFVPFWNHYFIWWWKSLQEYLSIDWIWSEWFRCELRASWCQVLQPSTGGNQYLEFYPPWALVKRDTEWRWVCFAFITAHGRGVSSDEVLARVRNRRGVCLCGNKSMQCFDYVYH